MNTNDNYSVNDYRSYLEHSWGKKPEQKAKEKEYNHSYYEKNKAKWKKYAENAGKKFGVGYKDEIEGAEIAAEAHKTNARVSDQQINAEKKRLEALEEQREFDVDRYRKARETELENRSALKKNGNLIELGGTKGIISYDVNDKNTIDRLNRLKDNRRNREIATDNLRRTQNAIRSSKNYISEKQAYSAKEKTAASASSRKAWRLKEAYSKTPLGKAENFVNSGRDAISNLLKKKK